MAASPENTAEAVAALTTDERSPSPLGSGTYFCAGKKRTGDPKDCADFDSRVSAAKKLWGVFRSVLGGIHRFAGDNELCSAWCAGVIGSGMFLADAACKVPGARAVGYGIPCMIGSSPMTPYLASLGGLGCIRGLCPSIARLTEGM